MPGACFDRNEHEEHKEEYVIIGANSPQPSVWYQSHVASKFVRILHKPSGTIIAEGPLGWWGITRFDGAYYVRRKYLRTAGFRITFIPGLCPYKFLYVWMDFWPDKEARSRKLGWMYWLANPIFPFIWFRVAIPQDHEEILVEDADAENNDKEHQE